MTFTKRDPVECLSDCVGKRLSEGLSECTMAVHCASGDAATVCLEQRLFIHHCQSIHPTVLIACTGAPLPMFLVSCSSLLFLRLHNLHFLDYPFSSDNAERIDRNRIGFGHVQYEPASHSQLVFVVRHCTHFAIFACS